MRWYERYCEDQLLYVDRLLKAQEIGRAEFPTLQKHWPIRPDHRVDREVLRLFMEQSEALWNRTYKDYLIDYKMMITSYISDNPVTVTVLSVVAVAAVAASVIGFIYYKNNNKQAISEAEGSPECVTNAEVNVSEVPEVPEVSEKCANKICCIYEPSVSGFDMSTYLSYMSPFLLFISLALLAFFIVFIYNFSYRSIKIGNLFLINNSFYWYIESVSNTYVIKSIINCAVVCKKFIKEKIILALVKQYKIWRNILI